MTSGADSETVDKGVKEGWVAEESKPVKCKAMSGEKRIVVTAKEQGQRRVFFG
jgi:hypothetical protein